MGTEILWCIWKKWIIIALESQNRTKIKQDSPLYFHPGLKLYPRQTEIWWRLPRVEGALLNIFIDVPVWSASHGERGRRWGGGGLALRGATGLTLCKDGSAYMTATNRRRSSLVEQNISSHLSAIFFSRFQSYVSSKEIPSYSSRKNEKNVRNFQFRFVHFVSYSFVRNVRNSEIDWKNSVGWSRLE